MYPPRLMESLLCVYMYSGGRGWGMLGEVVMPPTPLQPCLLWEGTAQGPGCESPLPLEGREQGAPFSITSGTSLSL